MIKLKIKIMWYKVLRFLGVKPDEIYYIGEAKPFRRLYQKRKKLT